MVHCTETYTCAHLYILRSRLHMSIQAVKTAYASAYTSFSTITAMHTYLAGSTSCAADSFVCCPPTVTCWVVKCELWCAQGTGYNGVPMGNMSNQQLMQMQLHGMDLQRAGAGYPGDTDDCLPACVCVRVRGVTGSPVHGCECIPCPAVLVCQNSGIIVWV